MPRERDNVNFYYPQRLSLKTKQYPSLFWRLWAGFVPRLLVIFLLRLVSELKFTNYRWTCLPAGRRGSLLINIKQGLMFINILRRSPQGHFLFSSSFYLQENKVANPYASKEVCSLIVQM